MALKTDLTNLSQRLADFAARFDEQTGRRLHKGEAPGLSGFFRTLASNVHDLFTRDVTHKSVLDLVKHETRDTIRFFTQGIDFDALRRHPWYLRYPWILWQVFLAMAYRLSPARRIAFVIGTFAFLVGWVQLISFSAESESATIHFLPPGAGWWLLAIVLFAFLLLMELRDKLGLKGDLEIAREIQFGLVPSRPFERNGFVFRHHMRPANTVGGDYYDIIELGDKQLALVIGDVAGKGMPAALLMALLQGSLRTLLTAGIRGTELISKLNDYLCANIPANRLVTLFYAELDTEQGALRYVNAGHNPPFLIHADGGSSERLMPTSVVLGFFQDHQFEACAAQLEPGTCLVLYTDGIVEAFNAAGQEYGDARLERHLRTHVHLPHSDLIKGLIEDVLAFCGDVRPGDDMTVLTVGRESGVEPW